MRISDILNGALTADNIRKQCCCCNVFFFLSLFISVERRLCSGYGTFRKGPTLVSINFSFALKFFNVSLKTWKMNFRARFFSDTWYESLYFRSTNEEVKVMKNPSSMITVSSHGQVFQDLCMCFGLLNLSNFVSRPYFVRAASREWTFPP